MWLMPEGEARTKLSKIIQEFSIQHNSALFEPHITLLGDIMEEENEVVNKVGKISASLRDLEVTLVSIGTRDTYFQSLFFEAKKGNALIFANKVAKDVFGKKHQFFQPHLSVLYSVLPLEEKKALISKMEGLLPLSFNVQKIHVLSASGEPKDWKIVKEIPFTGK